MPDNDIARAMIRAAGVPVAAPSANLSGRPSPTTAEAVAADLSGRVPLILDGGPCRFGVESTIVDCTGQDAVILRPGAVTREMLEEALGAAVRLDPALFGEDAVPRAPGMKYTHYAPRVPLTLIEAPPGRHGEVFGRALRKAKAEGKRPGLIVSRELAEALAPLRLVPPERVAVYGRAGDLSAMAANLYESLRCFDEAEADVLFAEAVEEEGLGLAVMNRLKKAAGGRILRAD